jgi:hypothetical protein
MEGNSNGSQMNGKEEVAARNNVRQMSAKSEEFILMQFLSS